MIMHFFFCNGWIDFLEAFYAVLHFMTLRNRLKISEYEVYLLTDFPLINS